MRAMPVAVAVPVPVAASRAVARTRTAARAVRPAMAAAATPMRVTPMPATTADLAPIPPGARVSIRSLLSKAIAAKHRAAVIARPARPIRVEMATDRTSVAMTAARISAANVPTANAVKGSRPIHSVRATSARTATGQAMAAMAAMAVVRVRRQPVAATARSAVSVNCRAADAHNLRFAASGAGAIPGPFPASCAGGGQRLHACPLRVSTPQTRPCAPA